MAMNSTKMEFLVLHLLIKQKKYIEYTGKQLSNIILHNTFPYMGNYSAHIFNILQYMHGSCIVIKNIEH